jgi:hypothetical protein
LLAKAKVRSFGLMANNRIFWMARYVLWHFGGEIVAIENFISENGKYRVLIAPDKMKINGQNN